MADDRRLIEDYLPIEAISKEASREKSVRKGIFPRCTCGGRGDRWSLVELRSTGHWFHRIGSGRRMGRNTSVTV